MYGEDMHRMMDMWMDLLSQIENDERRTTWNQRDRVGTVEDQDERIVLTADLPGVEKKDIELTVDSNSVLPCCATFVLSSNNYAYRTLQMIPA